MFQSTSTDFDVIEIPTTDERINLKINKSILERSNKSVQNIYDPNKQPSELLNKLKKEEEILDRIRFIISNQIQILQIDENAYEKQIMFENGELLINLESGDDIGQGFHVTSENYVEDDFNVDIDDEATKEMKSILRDKYGDNYNNE